MVGEKGEEMILIVTLFGVRVFGGQNRKLLILNITWFFVLFWWNIERK
jgi:hypothetical protein